MKVILLLISLISVIIVFTYTWAEDENSMSSTLSAEVSRDAIGKQQDLRKTIEDEQKRSIELTDRYEKLLEKNEQQAQRYDRILQKWEEQQAKMDDIIAYWQSDIPQEEVTVPSAPSDDLE